jgi:lipoprotein NlpD
MLGLSGALGAALLQGCASTAPAPVVDRGPSATQPRPAPIKPEPPLAPRIEPAIVAKPQVTPVAPLVPGTHVVRQGDTMFSIAKANGVTVRDLAAWNNVEDPSNIRVGQVLRLKPPEGVAVATPVPVETAPAPVEVAPVEVAPVPPPAEVKQVVKPIDIPPPTAGQPVKSEPQGQRVPYSDQAYAQMSKSAPPAGTPETPAASAARTAGDLEWAWPVQGKVIANFNDSTSKGIAIAGKLGQPVRASAGGRVIFSGSGLRGMGQLIVIRHNAAYLSVYAHNSKLLVKEGQTVTRGQTIAEMGSSDAEQVKLHFEIRHQGKPVDPTKFLPE